MIFKNSQTTPPLTTPPIVPPVAPPANPPIPPPSTSSTPSAPSAPNTAPSRKHIMPDANPQTGAPAEQTAEQKAEMAIAKLKEPMNRASNNWKIAKNNYETNQTIFDQKLTSSMASNMKMTGEISFCNVVIGMSDESSLVDPDELESSYHIWLQSAEAYKTAFNKYMQTYDSLLPQLENQPESSTKETTLTAYQAETSKERNDYNIATTKMTIMQRKNNKFFAVLPLQQEFFTLMSTLCPISTAKDTTLEKLGFAFNDQYNTLLNGYDQSIALAQAISRVITNTWTNGGRQSAMQNAGKYTAIAAAFEKQKQHLKNERDRRHRVQ
jgi:hypothetical protein